MSRIDQQALKTELAKRGFESMSIKRELPGGRIEIDSKPRFASSVFSVCWLMRGIGLWHGIPRAHHTGAARMLSTARMSAVDAHPAQHHLPSFAA